MPKETLAKFQPGDRVRMLSGPYAGQCGRRDHYNGGGALMVLVRFDGQPSHSLVCATDAAELEEKPKKK